MDFIINTSFLISLEEYIDMAIFKKTINKNKYFSIFSIICGVILFIGSTLSMLQGYLSNLTYIVYALVSIILVIYFDFIDIKVLSTISARNVYNTTKNRLLSTYIQVNNDKFIMFDDNNKFTLNKEDIFKICETKYNFIILESPNNIITNIPKRSLTNSQIEYIKNYIS